MTLCEKISLVNNLIKENPEVTIKEYLDTVQEIEGIRHSTFFIVRQSNFPVIHVESNDKKKKYYPSKYETPAKIHL